MMISRGLTVATSGETAACVPECGVAAGGGHLLPVGGELAAARPGARHQADPQLPPPRLRGAHLHSIWHRLRAHCLHSAG